MLSVAWMIVILVFHNASRHPKRKMFQSLYLMCIHDSSWGYSYGIFMVAWIKSVNHLRMSSTLLPSTRLLWTPPKFPPSIERDFFQFSRPITQIKPKNWKWFVYPRNKIRNPWAPTPSEKKTRKNFNLENGLKLHQIFETLSKLCTFGWQIG